MRPPGTTRVVCSKRGGGKFATVGLDRGLETFASVVGAPWIEYEIPEKGSSQLP
jgi:hypothetical protein